MTVPQWLDRWKDEGALSTEQYVFLEGLVHDRPFSVFLELNILFYAGVLAFAGGLGWTVRVYFRQLGDVVVISCLTSLLSACLAYCFLKSPAYSPAQPAAPNPVLDYVLYLGCLTWSIEVAFLETRYHLLSGQWDRYLLATACFYFVLAYRFDNRFVLSLALSTLAAWFGLTFAHGPDGYALYRGDAILYSVVIVAAGVALHYLGIKRHFLGTYLNLGANVFFWAVLSGVFDDDRFALWLLLLVAACAASIAYGVAKKQFSFVACAAVYGYIGISRILLRDLNNATSLLAYIVVSGICMVVLIARLARRFGRDS